MKITYNQFPFHKKHFSICDSQIDTIICKENSVRFVFSNGFFKVENDRVVSTSTGYVEFIDCSPDEFFCYIIQREATNKGAKLHGEPVALSDLSNILSEDNRKIELYLELYDFNNLHWRGALLPYKEHGLSDNVVIELSGCFTTVFSWR